MLRRIALPGFFVLVAAAVAMWPDGALAGGGGCHAEEVSDRSGVEVSLSRACFEPMVLRVEAGQTVTWTNDDPMAHAVTGVAGSFGDYRQLNTGDTVTHRFDEPGVYPYFCVLHPSMVGAVVLGDGLVSSKAHASGEPAGDTVSAAEGGSTTGAAMPLAIGLAGLASGAGLAFVWRCRRV